MTAIYADAKGVPRASIIFDVPCYLGAAMQDADVREATVSIENHLIPKAMFDICKSFMNLISTSIHERQQDIELNSKGMHLVNDPQGKLKALVEKTVANSSYLSVQVESYGRGKMCLIKL